MFASCLSIYVVRSIQCSQGSAVCLVKAAAVHSLVDVNAGEPNKPLSLPRDSKGSSVGQSVFVLAFPVLWLSLSPRSSWYVAHLINRS